MIQVRKWILPVLGGATVWLLGGAALSSGDRLRVEAINRKAQVEAVEIIASIQERILTMSHALARVPIPLDATQIHDLLAEDDVVIWHYNGQSLMALPDSLGSDAALSSQISISNLPLVIAPLTTSGGSDLALITSPRGDGWVGATLPMQKLVPSANPTALSPYSVTLSWSDRERSDAIYSATRDPQTRMNRIEFPIAGGHWSLGYNSIAEQQSHELRWTLIIATLLLGYAAGLVLYRLGRAPSALTRDLLRSNERFNAANDELTKVLASRDLVEDQFRQLSVTDAETELPNRQAFVELIDDTLLRMRRCSESLGLTVVVVGLRDVENAEHTLGHNLSASIIRQLATKLRGALPTNCAVARVAHYHLAILLPEHNRNAAIDVAAKLTDTDLPGVYTYESGSVSLTPRMGMSITDDGYRDAEGLLNDAMSALTDAESSSSRWSIFKASRRDERATMIQLESEIRSAIENNEFRLFYQPIVYTDSGKPRGFECLVRWDHPVEGLLPPSRFIGLCESSGLITDLTRWALREAVRQAQAWENLEKLGGYLSVNLSTLDLQRDSFLDELLELVTSANLSPTMLRLEITESMLIGNLAQSANLLNRIRDAGFGIMMDDFGTGFSSLSYLRQLPFSAVKIDQSFTQAITWDSKAYGMMRSILGLVHFLEMESVIEGIETSEQADLLRPLGPLYCQGYLYSKPMPAIDAEEYLAAATLDLPRSTGGQ